VSAKKEQKWFKTNLDYDATWKKLQKSQTVGGASESFGRYTFYLKDPKNVTVQITTKRKLSITYPEKMDPEKILERIELWLVKDDGTPAEILDEIKVPDEIVKELKIGSQLVEKVLEELRFKFCGEVSVEDVALKVGKAPKEVRVMLYELAPKTGWKPPTDEAIEERRQNAADFLRDASELRYLEPELYEKSREVKLYCEKYPHLLPDIWEYTDQEGHFEFFFPELAREVVGNHGYFEENLGAMQIERHLMRKAGFNCHPIRKCSICGEVAESNDSTLDWISYHKKCRSFICSKCFGRKPYPGVRCPICKRRMKIRMPSYLEKKITIVSE